MGGKDSANIKPNGLWGKDESEMNTENIKKDQNKDESAPSRMGLWGRDAPSRMGLWGKDAPSMKSRMGLWGKDNELEAIERKPTGLWGKDSSKDVDGDQFPDSMLQQLFVPHE